jgi:pSer/pThr/pTyr-binding forkhead associated (FHA) protein
MAKLCLLSDDGTATQRWEIGEQPVAVGRGEGADIVIQDQALSRLHFQITRQGDHYLIKDLQSQNGTFVDGQATQTTTLHESECILAGRSVFVFTQ